MENENRDKTDESSQLSPKQFLWWRRLHILSSGLLGLISLAHSGLTLIIYSNWSPDAVWFLGTGLGLLLLTVSNLSHIGAKPCHERSAPFVHWANWCFLLFGISALVAIPEPQAYAIVFCLAGQAISSNWTIPGPQKIFT